MSTRAIVAQPTADGGWEGHTVHSSGHPTDLGRRLHAAITHFGTVQAMREFFIDQHTGLLQFADPTDLRAEDDPRPDHDRDPDGWKRYQNATVCTCCASGAERDEPYRHTDIGQRDGPWDIQWLYILAEDGLRVHTGHRHFAHVGTAPWGEPVGDAQWQVLECGEDFERCGHYAWVHLPDLPDDCRSLSMRTYLGREPFCHQDATAAVIDGERVILHRSGHRERLRSGVDTGGYGDRWIGAVEHAGGRVEDLPLWYVAGPNAGKWVEGVEPIFPPVLARVPSWWKPPQATFTAA